MRIFKKVTLLLLLVGLIQLLILTGFIFTHVESTLRTTIHRSLFSLATEVGLEVNRVVYEAYQNILLLSQNPFIASSKTSREDQKKELVKTQNFHRIFKDITLLDSAGEISASVLYSFKGNCKATHWFQSAIQGKAVISDVHAVLYPFEVVMLVAAPFYNEYGDIAGVLVGQIEMERIWEITKNVSVGKEGEVFLVDRKGVIIAAPDHSQILERMPYDDIYQRVIQRIVGVTEVKNESKDYLALHVPIGAQKIFEFSVVIIQPKSAAYASVYHLRPGLLCALIICLTVIIVLSPLVSRQVTQRVHRLVDATRSLGKGDVSTQVGDLGTDEIGELGNALNWASQELSISQKKIMEYSEHLEAMVEKRTEELKKIQEKLIKTAHMAGMAEVATGVIHNIGNAINSVNIRIRFIKEMLEGLRCNRLMDAVEMLESHTGQLDRYLKKDPRGEKIIPYMKLSLKQMTEQRKEAITDIDFLDNQVKHICDMITIQQSYAHGDKGVREELQITEILIDAIRMLSDMLEKNNVRIKSDFNYFERILLNRHQLIQVFVNLIKNACQSIVSAEPDERLIYISTRIVNDNGHKNQMLEISVRDTGEGFSPEIRERMFNYGFTTKDIGGKGFGLHFCANYLQSIQGVIQAESEGPKKGATFFVKIPIERARIKQKETIKHG